MLNYSVENLNKIHLLPEDYDRYIPELIFSKGNLSETGRAYLEQCRKNLESLLSQDYHTENLIRLRSRMIDKLIINLFEICEEEAIIRSQHTGSRAVLMALGGYGRSEMNLASDIDLLFLYPKKRGAYIEILTEKMLYVLWDLGCDVGYATRTIAECLKGLFEDVTIMTALLDARFLAGNHALANDFSKRLKAELKPISVQKKLIRFKLDEWKQRIQKQGGSVFVLEPNVRDSGGGLRDLHLLLWIAKIQGRKGTYEELRDEGLIREDEYQALITARNFLWRVRNELHLNVKKKVDILTFHFQEAIAGRMGYEDSSGILAVEKFMQDYYKLANQVALITEMLIRRMTEEDQGGLKLVSKFKTKNVDDSFKLINDQIGVRRPTIFQDDPLNLLKIFEYVQEMGLTLHADTKDLIPASLRLVDDSFRANPEAIRIFRRMLNHYKNLGLTLLAMHEVHFLEEWIPEFKKLVCRVQHDIYHFYTIDTHSIFAVNELSKLDQGEYEPKFSLFRQALKEVTQPELLTLGLFLHDIGKGEGGNHSVKGAVIANGLTQRLGYFLEEQKTVEFLVLSHLMMPHLSQRRDLEDQELIIQFARSMGTMDRLNMLFLLTWGDIRAVGPSAWTDWKGALLEKLYEKTREFITRGEFSKEKTRERVTRVKESLIAKMGERYDKDELQKFLSMMPPRYFFAASDEDIERHFLVIFQGQEEKVVLKHRLISEQNLNQVLIYTINTPHLFAQVTGLMSACALNILSIDLFQTTDGHVLLNLGITDARGMPIVEEDRFQEIEKLLKEVLTGKIKVHDLIAKRKVPDYLIKKPIQKAKSRVAIDNDVSAYYTVIDVYAHDRLGLLYEITQTLNQLGCYVEVSKISTKVDQVTDVFYVKDIFGKKIISQEKLKQIKEELSRIVEKEV